MELVALLLILIAVFCAFCFSILPAVHAIFIIVAIVCVIGTILVLFDKESSVKEKFETVGGMGLLIITGLFIVAIVEIFAGFLGG